VLGLGTRSFIYFPQFVTLSSLTDGQYKAAAEKSYRCLVTGCC